MATNSAKQRKIPVKPSRLSPKGLEAVYEDCIEDGQNYIANKYDPAAKLKFLESVYTLSIELFDLKNPMARLRRWAKDLDIKLYKSSDPVTSIIRLTSDLDARESARLKYPILLAIDKRIDQRDFKDFLQRQGGVAGCTATYRRLDPKYEKRLGDNTAISRVLTKIKKELAVTKGEGWLKLEIHRSLNGRIRVVSCEYSEEQTW